MLLSQLITGRQRTREFIACKSPFAKSAFAGLQRFQRDIASFHPLFFIPARLRNSKISAAKAMPLAANFLQKQQKQWQRPFGRRRPLEPGAPDRSGFCRTLAARLSRAEPHAV